MGSMFVAGYKDCIDKGLVSLEHAIRQHLVYNFVPSIPTYMTEVCIRAIKKANKGQWEKRVRLPEGILYKNKYKTAPVYAVIEFHHLEGFLDNTEDY